MIFTVYNIIIFIILIYNLLKIFKNYILIHLISKYSTKIINKINNY